jgi:hypothetical protein
MFDELKKFRMILNSDTIEREDFESFVNYLELEKVRRNYLFKKWKVGSFREYNEKYHNG